MSPPPEKTVAYSPPHIRELREKEMAATAVLGPLWPEPFWSDTVNAAIRFMVECCRTFDEETSEVSQIPDLEFVGQACEAWYWSRKTGRTLIVEKSRRLMYTWIVTCLEVWAMGLHRENRVVAGPTYPKAAEFVWRHAFVYRQLPAEWKLADCTTRGGNFAARDVPQVIFPNGSMVNAANAESETLQGSGCAGIRLEELSLYRRPQAFLAQAQIVTGGRHGVAGGHVVAITNASPNKEWQACKRVRELIFNLDPTFVPPSARL